VLLEIANRVRDTGSEGPGRRYALWVQGCRIRCAGCCNPEMFERGRGELLAVEAVSDEILSTPGLEGVTFLGGEPMEQAEPLSAVARRVRQAGLSVMTFTGFVLEDLRREGDAARLALLAETDLLADGPFDSGQRGSSHPWLGSKNQRLHFLSPRYRGDEPAFAPINTVELRLSKGELEMSGWAPAILRATRTRGP
jgi:anaerobic ribonucleoside-triphosphate reductase activating protein